MSDWINWQNDPGAWATTLICAIGIVGAIVAYLRLNHVKKLHGSAAMPVLRCLALGAIAIAAWRPTQVSTTVGGPLRPTTILVDDTTSMSVIDTDRPPGEALRVAVELGQIAPSPRDRATGSFLTALRSLDPLFQTLIDAQQRDASPDRSAVSESTIRQAAAAISAEIEQLKNQAAADPATLFTTARLAAMLSHIDPQLPPPRDQLSGLISDLVHRENVLDDDLARNDPVCRAAARRVLQQSRFDLACQSANRLAELLRPSGGATVAAIDGQPLKPDANPTRQIESLASTLRQASAANEQADALIFISDGRSNQSRTIVSSALSGTMIPIDTVSVTAGGPTSIVRVTKIDVPHHALLHETIDVRIHVVHRGAVARSVLITLTDGRATQQQTVRLPAGETVIDFQWPITVSPLVQFTCHVALADTGRAAAGVTHAQVHVNDHRIRVLMLSSFSGSDSHAIQNALNTTPWVELTTPTTEAPLTAEMLAAQDVIICGDLFPGSLSDNEAQMVRQAVENSGKSLLMLPSTDALADPFKLPRDIAELLPFRHPGVIAATTQHRSPATTQAGTVIAVPTHDAIFAGIIDRDFSFNAVVRDWLARPRLVRPVDTGLLKPNARAIVVDRETQQPIVTDATAGAGRAMTVLSDDIWRWGDLQDAFWKSLVRALDDAGPFAHEAQGLALDVDTGPIHVDENYWLRIGTKRGAADPLTVALLRDGNVEQTLWTREWPPGSGRYMSSFSEDSPGNIVIDCRQGDRSLSVAIAIAPPEPESEDTTPDPGLLRRVADVTGGTAFTLDHLDDVAPDLIAQRATRDAVTTNPIWCSPYMFAFIIGCLGCEWALRKHMGLI